MRVKSNMAHDPYCYLNGRTSRLSKMHLQLNDLGVLRAYGIFDYLRTLDGHPILLDEHIARFYRSAKRLGLTIPVSVTELKNITQNLIRKNKFKETSIKFVLTGGPSEDGLTVTSKPTFYVLASEVHDPHPRFYVDGASLETYEYLRLLPDIKTINYIISVQKQKEFKRKGVLEPLYVYGGNVLECSSSNIFIVKNGVLATPKDNILIGTSRNQLIKVARKKYKIEERDVRVQELKDADEVFMTASNKSVMPVTRINGRKVGDGKVGPIARELRRLYDDSIRHRRSVARV